MKIKNFIILFALFLVITACKDDDTINTDPVKQSKIDDKDLVEYLETHYLNEDRVILKITEDQTPLMEQVEVEDIIENGINYKQYFLIEEKGTITAPTAKDSVLVSYKGQTLESKVFDYNKLTIFSLPDMIKGWQYGFPNYKSGTKVLYPDESFDYEGYGQGILFIPSGLAYGITGASGIPPNTPLVFFITLQEVRTGAEEE